VLSLSAVIYPNQTSRTFLSLTADGQALSQLDMLQQETIASLAKLVQGREEVTPPPKRRPVSLITETSSENLPSYLDSRQANRLRYLRDTFPTIATENLQRIFPLFDPLDLDLIFTWSIPSSSRRGRAFLHSLRLSPEFSIVDDIRMEVDAAIAKGGKQTRTMYEETGRLRRVLMDSVLDGVLSLEEDPVVVKVGVGGKRRRGLFAHDFGKG